MLVIDNLGVSDKEVTMIKLIFIFMIALSSTAKAQFADSLGLSPFTDDSPFYQITDGTEFSFWYKVADREKYFYRDMAYAVFEANNVKRTKVETKACHAKYPLENLKKTITRNNQEERRRLMLDMEMGRQTLDEYQEKAILGLCKKKNGQRWKDKPSKETLACVDKEVLFKAFNQKKLLSDYEIAKGELERCLGNIHGTYPEGDVFPYYNGSYAQEYLSEFWNEKSRKCYFEDEWCK